MPATPGWWVAASIHAKEWHAALGLRDQVRMTARNTRIARGQPTLEATIGTLKQRVNELEATAAAAGRTAQTQAALYRIATLASAARDMPEFYRGIHAILGELIYAENIYIALYDGDRRQINFAYWADTVDTDWPNPRAWDVLGEGYSKGLTGYVLRTGRLLHANTEAQQRLVDEEGLEFIGAMANDYLGVPLDTEGRTIGVLALQSYRPEIAYTEDDEQLLTFVGRHIAAALERTRAAAEIRQRNAELAIVNEVGQALGKQLDFEAITELVGVRIHSIFPGNDMFVALYEAEAALITFPYEIANEERFHSDPIPLGEGLTSEVIRTKRPLLIRTRKEGHEHRMLEIGPTSQHESWLGVPIITGDTVLGVIALETKEPYAFSVDDERLLTTLAASTSVALENARGDGRFSHGGKCRGGWPWRNVPPRHRGGRGCGGFHADPCGAARASPGPDRRPLGARRRRQRHEPEDPRHAARTVGCNRSGDGVGEGSSGVDPGR
jgi:GAF domain-containing protein